MSLFQEPSFSWFTRFCINVLKAGPIPKHIALIMDGNRRFATAKGMEKTHGHPMGFKKFAETLEWCLKLGITEISIYMFSIDNFKRSKEEVNCLFNFVFERFSELVNDKEILLKRGICIRIFGELTLLPTNLQKVLAEAALLTYNNTKFYLNVCMAYTARQEIASAVKTLATAVVKGKITESDINRSLFENTLYSSKSSYPDIVIRTSGEVRLSDFLLWQCQYSILSFFKVLWPDFRIWHLALAILDYQRNYQKLKQIEKHHNLELENAEKEKDADISIQPCQTLRNLPENSLGDVNKSEMAFQEEQVESRRKNILVDWENEYYKILTQIREGNTIQRKPDFS